MTLATEHKISTGQASDQSCTYSVSGVDATGMVTGMTRSGVDPLEPAIMNAVYDRANRIRKNGDRDHLIENA